MRKSVAVCLVSIASLVAGCGGDSSEDHNAQIIEDAGSETAAMDAIHDALDEQLTLGFYAGVDDTFLPEGGPCQPLISGQTSRCCSIQDIVVGDDVDFAKDGDAAIVGPDDAYVVEVGQFAGADPALCLQAVSDAVDEIGIPET